MYNILMIHIHNDTHNFKMHFINAKLKIIDKKKKIGKILYILINFNIKNCLYDAMK